MLGTIKTMDKEGNTAKARELYYEIIESSTSPEVIARAKDRLSEINSEVLWSPEIDEFGQIYVVERGDSPIVIASKFKTTARYISEANGITGNIHPGKRLKVPKEPLYVVVDKTQCRLDLLTESGRFVKWYPVGVENRVGKHLQGNTRLLTRKSIPSGLSPVVVKFCRIIRKMPGTRWMGIETVSGFTEPMHRKRLASARAPDAFGCITGCGRTV